jgi:hypothetical protein
MHQRNLPESMRSIRNITVACDAKAGRTDGTCFVLGSGMAGKCDNLGMMNE